MKRAWKAVFVYGIVALAVLFAVNMGSKAITTLSENKPIVREHCIVIDPGHGGEDGGAVSYSGLPESTYNLSIAIRTNDLLNLLGYQTKMIRTSDVSVYTRGETLSQKKASDLIERVRIINETEDALMISIHQNHYPDAKYSGAQVFYAKTEGSEAFAKHLQAAFIATLNPGSHRQAKKSSGIYLMEHIRCPGVLIECGFLSNPEEDSNLKKSDYQKKLSAVITTAIGQYLSNA